MVDANFEHEGNSGLLTITTHFDKSFEIACVKWSDETFRLGGTAINEVAAYEGLVLRLPDLPSSAKFRAFRTPEVYFEDMGVMSSEAWTKADLHCFITEYYTLDMEGKSHGWFISQNPILDANHLFINLDVLDGGGNVVKRYRVSPFTGEHKVMENLNV